MEAPASWNAKLAGKYVALKPGNHGYRVVGIMDMSFLAHRVIWAMHYGAWPLDEIDHINHDRADNRIVNLRDVKSTENLKNKRIYPRNTTGLTGVSWHKQNKKWTAQIRVNNEQKFLGIFQTKQEAHQIRKAAEVQYGYHPNHGT